MPHFKDPSEGTVVHTPAHVTELEGQRILTFCCDLPKSFLLCNYKVAIANDPADEDSVAHITVSPQRHYATIYLSVDWMEREEEERFNCIIHEIMHIWHHRLTTHVEAIQESGCLPNTTYDVWYESVRKEAEFMCDGIANAVQEFLQVRARWDELGKPRKAKKKKGKKK